MYPYPIYVYIFVWVTKVGTFVGSVGWVMQVEQGPDTDIVTFMETLIKKGEAQDISIFRLS
jgi:hypothetical protein